ncbi:XrtA/PEP-CTERM system histidine kinase PrsK [Bowmanella sp. JS7-9]|uniref:histidine kinase n=2 Tax=Pseudobowmanella zhangzhouensis TaxID=1537679 RepID=A0ABW1XG23_9ALTE|nr:XrtA/PEP-CTERM system histidine kinase PrsK [Bowmanella sp. JS7-9]
MLTLLDASGYFLSALGFSILSLLILFTPTRGLPKKLLLIATTATLFDTLMQGVAVFVLIPFDILFAIESIKQLFWVIFLLSCLRQTSSNSLLNLLRTPTSLAFLPLPILAAIFSLILIKIDTAYLSWLFLFQTILNLQILIMLEAFYRQSDHYRWAYKPLIIAIGGLAVFDFVMFSQASMVGRMDQMLWSARGYIYAISIPFLVIAIRRIKEWGVDIFISREIVTGSTLVIVAGAYLLLMSLAGYAIKFIGGQWTSVLQVVFVFLALVLLAALLLSNQFRTEVKVFITKHFFANQFDYRVEWVNLTQQLEEGAKVGANHYVTALNALARTLGVNRGNLLRINGHDFEVLAQLDDNGLNDTDLKTLNYFIPFVQQKHWIIDIDQLRSRPFDYEGMRVNLAQLNACSFHLVIPIFQGDNLWGIAVLTDKDKKRPALNWEVRDYLSVVANQVGAYLFQYEASKQLAENAQFAAFSRMSAFVVHDLKNVLAQIDLILSNADQHRHNPEFIDDTFETLQHTKSRMEKMLRQLTEKQDDSSTGLVKTHLSSVIDEVVNKRCQLLAPLPMVEYQTDPELTLDADKLANVLYHLVSNAQQATPDNGEVRVLSYDESDMLCIDIIDTGCGMSQEFIAERLFAPFDTTKGNAGMGIGAYDAKHYAEKMGGRLEVVSQVGKGTRFTLKIPR